MSFDSLRRAPGLPRARRVVIVATGGDPGGLQGSEQLAEAMISIVHQSEPVGEAGAVEGNAAGAMDLGPVHSGTCLLHESRASFQATVDLSHDRVHVET